jgi:hypothetical protein
MRTLKLTLPLTLALALVAGLSAADDPKTPLGKWMKPNMGAPMAGQDFDALKKSFDLVAGKGAPSAAYANWVSLLKQGSTAAGASDLSGVKAACKGCHDQYKQNYIKDFPDKPFP